MPSYTIKVPNDDEGEDLGEYEADYLPRVGDPFVLWHPRINPKEDEPFCGVVSMVTHEATFLSVAAEDGKSTSESYVETTVWLAEEHAPPELFCDCSEKEREGSEVVDGACDNCGHVRRS